MQPGISERPDTDFPIVLSMIRKIESGLEIKPRNSIKADAAFAEVAFAFVRA